MKIYKGFETYQSAGPACVTTGTFDGVHIGHKKLLQKMAKASKEKNLTSVLVTFDPHPRRVLFPEQEGLQLINSLDEKLELLEESGLDAIIVQPFTQEFSRTTALLYVRDLLVTKVGMKKLVIGYDHQFGKNREGSIQNLKEMAPLFDFEVDEIPAQEIDDAKVSSTKIRYALNDGNIDEANAYLGYDFFVSGKVVEGDGRGKELGYPTANILTDESKIVPGSGVYAVSVTLGNENFDGVANIGTKPTFNEVAKTSLEVHLLDYDKNLYGKQLRVAFKQRLRDEQRFESATMLKSQIAKDIEKAQAVL